MLLSLTKCHKATRVQYPWKDNKKIYVFRGFLNFLTHTDQKLIAFFCKASPVLCNLDFVLSKHVKVCNIQHALCKCLYVFIHFSALSGHISLCLCLYSLVKGEVISGTAKKMQFQKKRKKKKKHNLLLVEKKDSSSLSSCHWLSRHCWAGILVAFTNSQFQT